MEYRRLGRTGLMVSAISLGGHWKRSKSSWKGQDSGAVFRQRLLLSKIPGFVQSRDRVLSHSIDVGINYLDAMAAPECWSTAAAQGRRDKIYFGYAGGRRSRAFRNIAMPMRCCRAGRKLKASQLDYVDLWRIALPMEGVPDLSELERVEEATIAGLAKASSREGAVHGGVFAQPGVAEVADRGLPEADRSGHFPVYGE